MSETKQSAMQGKAFSGKPVVLHVKNKATGKCDTIEQHDIEFVDWGFRFFVDSELNAYKAAYQYRHNKFGCRVEFAQGMQQWMVTVFNEVAERTGINR